MEKTLEMYNSTAVPPGNRPIDPRGDPKYFDYTWTNWMDYVEPKNHSEIMHEESKWLNSGQAQRLTESEIEFWLKSKHLAIMFGSN